MSKQLTRHLRLLEILKDSRRFNPMSVKTILTSLEDNYLIKVDKRTIQRDLPFLAETFFGLDSIMLSDGGYGWYWRDDAKVVLIAGLTPAQALSFTLIKKYLTQLFPSVALNELEPFFEYSEEALTRLQGNAIVKWPKKIAVVQPTQTLIPPQVDRDVQRIVSEVLLSETQLEIEYQRLGQAVSSYMLNPLGLVIRGSITYLIATKAPQNEFRLFALQRIKKAQPINTPIEMPIDFDLQKYIAEGHMGFNMNGHTLKSIELVVVFDKRAVNHFYESPLSNDQQIVEYSEDRVLLSATVVDNEQLYWWLLGYGAQAQVLEPEHLRRQMVDTIRGMAAQYEI